MDKIKQLIKETVIIAELAPCAFEGSSENEIWMSDALDEIAANLHKILKIFEIEVDDGN